MPGFDPPRLGGYTLINPPNAINVRWNAVQQVNELADGSTRQRLLGYQFQAELIWEDAWIRLQDWTGLMAVANDTTGIAGTGLGALTFIPRNTTFPSRTFSVLWINKFDFINWNGKFGAYGGKIELVGITPTASASEIM